MIIDSQVHTYERNHPGRPWVDVLHGPAEVTGEQMIAAMDEVGVDAALLVSPWLLYREDASYAVDVRAKHPDRFALVRPLDPANPAVSDVIAEWAATPGAVGVRVLMLPPVATGADDPGLNRVLTTAAQHALPVNLMANNVLEQARALAARHADVQIVIDHVGMGQAVEPPGKPDPFADLPKLLALAPYENVAVKLSGAVTMSKEPYPFRDLWDSLARIFDAFGFDRCLWGTDWTRALAFASYREMVDAFRLTERLTADERAALMGGSLQKVYRWTPGVASRP